MSTSNDCNCDDPGPEFVLNPAIGTTPCDINGATSTTPCDPDACCSFFRTCEADGSNNFVYAAGGPFQFNDLTRLLAPAPGFIDPGPLDGIVCIPGLPPGTYQVEVRMEVTTTSSVTVLFFPDCDDDTVAYAVLNFSGNVTGQTITGFLYVAISGCNPGFELTGCTASIQNFELSMRRVSGRQLIDCSGSDLLTIDTSGIGTPCGQ
jgi:hypothetical protein